ncbi:MAG: glyoxalase [Spirochaetales bacterium]|nr:glyoxalase [Spirochaetales bacterium]
MAAIQGFHHVAMKVKNFDASADFYTQVLGLSRGKSWGEPGSRVLMVDAGNGNYMELFEGGKGHAGDGAVTHVAFRTDDCDEVMARVRESGAEITTENKDVDLKSDPVFPVRIAFFKGPDDEIIEIFQER